MKHNYYKAGDHNAICDMCGFKFKASQLKKTWNGFMVCSADFETRHIADFIKGPRASIPLPWTRPEKDDSFVDRVVDIPNDGSITNFVLTDYTNILPTPAVPTIYITPPTGEGPQEVVKRVIINIPEGVTIDGSFDFGDGWPVDTEFVVNNNGKVLVVPDFPDNSTITVNGVPFGEPAVNEDYTIDWRIGQFPPPVLVFDVQPTDVAESTSISPAVEVWIVGNLSIAITNVVFKVQLTIGVNAGTPAGVLTGGTETSTVSGVATFSALQIDEAGDGYRLIASVV